MTKVWAYVGAHPYLVMFALMLVEGPLAMVTSGMLVSTGLMTFALAALLAVAADVGADSAYFLAGRLARRSTGNSRTTRLLARMGATAERRSRLEASVRGNFVRIMLGAKVFDSAAIPVIATAGGSGVPYLRFLRWNLAFTVPKATLLVALGALVGDQVRPYLTPTNGLLFAAAGAAGWLALIGVRRVSNRWQPVKMEA
jgi:membrane protein DedA with SNARE-associated domain